MVGCPGFTDAGGLALPALQPDSGPSGLLAEDALITMIGRVREPVSPPLAGDPRRAGHPAGLAGPAWPAVHRRAPRCAAAPLVAVGAVAGCELGLPLRLFEADLAGDCAASCP